MLLASQTRLERATPGLGGSCSIQLSYWDIYQKYSIFPPKRIRTNCRLGGDRSIQLSYGGLYRKYSILQGSRIRTIRFLGGACYIHLTTEAYKAIFNFAGLQDSASSIVSRLALYPSEPQEQKNQRSFSDLRFQKEKELHREVQAHSNHEDIGPSLIGRSDIDNLLYCFFEAKSSAVTPGRLWRHRFWPLLPRAVLHRNLRFPACYGLPR